MKHSVYIVGEAKAQPRARSAKFRRDDGTIAIRQYSPPTAANWRYSVSIGLARVSEAFGHPIAEACRVDIHIFFERPGSHWRSGQEYKVIKAAAPIYHTSRPDLDNVYKLIMDAGTGVGLFSDDCKVVLGELTKKYATHEPPGCLVSVSTDLGPLTMGDLYNSDLLDLTKNPRRIPANASFTPGALPTPTVVPMIKQQTAQ